MEKIIIKKIQEEKHPLYFKEEFIDNINESELNQLRIDIMKTYSKEGRALKEPSNYKLFFEGNYIDILSSGEVEHYPKGMFDLFQKQFAEIVRIKRS